MFVDGPEVLPRLGPCHYPGSQAHHVRVARQGLPPVRPGADGRDGGPDASALVVVAQPRLQDREVNRAQVTPIPEWLQSARRSSLT